MNLPTNIIKTIAPIAIEDLKKYFLDKSITYNIDYTNSKIFLIWIYPAILALMIKMNKRNF